MKKVLFVLAFVAVYGVSLAMTSSTQVASVDQAITIVADVNDLVDSPVVEKEESKKETKAKAKGETKAKSKAKAEGCSGEKTAKKDCSSSCSGKKK